MTQYVVSPRAQRDIEDIWDYTAEQWSNAQAERYIRLIQEAIETIAADPRRGRLCENIRANYRKFSVGSHVIFFRWTPGNSEIDVVRILHQRMDFERHL
jgi:toxin ParE1/3/4